MFKPLTFGGKMEKTPVGVNPHGLTQFINNLGRDCLPDQFKKLKKKKVQL